MRRRGVIDGGYGSMVPWGDTAAGVVSGFMDLVPPWRAGFSWPWPQAKVGRPQGEKKELGRVGKAMHMLVQQFLHGIFWKDLVARHAITMHYKRAGTLRATSFSYRPTRPAATNGMRPMWGIVRAKPYARLFWQHAGTSTLCSCLRDLYVSYNRPHRSRCGCGRTVQRGGKGMPWCGGGNSNESSMCAGQLEIPI